MIRHTRFCLDTPYWLLMRDLAKNQLYSAQISIRL
jgi:hypothetical protein